MSTPTSAHVWAAGQRLQDVASERMHYLAAGVCPVAPSGLSSYSNTIEGNVKWGVILMIAIAFFVGIGAIVGGRITHHPPTSRFGLLTLITDIIAAVLMVGGYAIVVGILGSGCGTA